MSLSLTTTFKSIAFIALGSCVLQATLPEAWEVYGSTRGDYEYGVDPSAAYNGQPSTCLKSKPSASLDGYGMVQPAASLELHSYRGKRVRFSANVKAKGVAGWAGLWMRVNGAPDRKNRHSSTLAYDNMQNRPITGTVGWQKYSVVLDVPSKASGIYLGMTLTGTGEVWLNGVNVEVVGKKVPTTGVR